MDYIQRAKYWGRKIRRHYQSHKVKIKINYYQIIPGLQRYIYHIKPCKGTREQQIFDRAIDIKGALGLHFFYAYKDGFSIRIAVSEHKIVQNKLLNILKSPLFAKSDMKIPLALGYDLTGNMHIVDLAKLLHLLIVGPSGSGKSVALQCLILSIITRCSVNTVKLLIFDIGGGSLSIFRDVAHLYSTIIKDTETGMLVLEALVAEMDWRYTLD
jgi:S-DNA-T family DNA segregation ATPase FtsK/SpoIIIE